MVQREIRRIKIRFPKEYFYGKNNIQGIKANPMGIT
jgi:hypothetical protein